MIMPNRLRVGTWGWSYGRIASGAVASGAYCLIRYGE